MFRLSYYHYLFIIILTGFCLTQLTGTALSEEKRAAIIPFKSTDEIVSDHFEVSLAKCLEENGNFIFVNRDKVKELIEKENMNVRKTFGLKAKQYQFLAKELDVDIIIHGGLSVLKSLKFNGWRKDISVSTRIYDGSTGKKTDSFKTDTSFKFEKSETEKDAEKMADNAAETVCKRILKTK